MPSTFELSFLEMQQAVSRYLGWGESPAGEALTLARHYANDGYAEFLAGGDDPDRGPHRWSFLAPRAEIDLWPDQVAALDGAPAYSAAGGFSTVALHSAATVYESVPGASLSVEGGGEYVVTARLSASTARVDANASGEADGATATLEAGRAYALPDDFGEMIDDPVYPADSAVRTLLRRPPETVALVAASAQAGPPRMYAVLPADPSGPVARRRLLVVDRVPDAPYRLSYRYRIQPGKLVADDDVPLGGADHRQAILACCLAAAEAAHNDGLTAGHRDVHRDRARLLLSLSIVRDRRRSASNLGPMAGPRLAARPADRGAVSYEI
jgi:hypothetical protein